MPGASPIGTLFYSVSLQEIMSCCVNVMDPIRCAFYIPEVWFLIGPKMAEK